MNYDFLIKSTNKIALWSVIALCYWLFIFIIITVLDLKIFREHITETFFMSVLGIFALLGGALVLNVMSNLSKISASLPSQSEVVAKPFKKRWWLLSFPLILAAMLAGNTLSAQHKERLLVNAAVNLVQKNQDYSAAFANYTFDENYITNTSHALEVISKIDENFPEIFVIQHDVIDQKTVLLKFSNYYRPTDAPLNKTDYIFPTEKRERDYLEQVFSGKTNDYLFSARQGNYALYYPVNVNGKRYVMYFSDYQRYGKIGSS